MSRAKVADLAYETPAYAQGQIVRGSGGTRKDRQSDVSTSDPFTCPTHGTFNGSVHPDCPACAGDPANYRSQGQIYNLSAPHACACTREDDGKGVAPCHHCDGGGDHEHTPGCPCESSALHPHDRRREPNNDAPVPVDDAPMVDPFTCDEHGTFDGDRFAYCPTCRAEDDAARAELRRDANPLRGLAPRTNSRAQ